jgi:excisionase family DNA binding protein
VICRENTPNKAPTSRLEATSPDPARILPVSAKTRGNTPRLALSRAEAAASLGMSVDSFERYVQGQVRLVRLGRLVLVPLSELERWLEANAALTLEEWA